MAAGTGARQARETMDAYEERTGEKLSPVTRSAVQVGGSIVGSASWLYQFLATCFVNWRGLWLSAVVWFSRGA